MKEIMIAVNETKEVYKELVAMQARLFTAETQLADRTIKLMSAKGCLSMRGIIGKSRGHASFTVTAMQNIPPLVIHVQSSRKITRSQPLRQQGLIFRPERKSGLLLHPSQARDH